MYSVRLGYAVAVQRVNALMQNGHHAEALVTAAFTIEKTLRRTLRQLMISAGFTSKSADKIVGQLRGLDAIKNAWELYDPRERKLTTIVAPNDWKTIKDCANKRNELVHGVRVFSLNEYETQAKALLTALDNVKTMLDAEYGYSGWTTATKRLKSQLHLDPKVTI